MKLAKEYVHLVKRYWFVEFQHKSGMVAIISPQNIQNIAKDSQKVLFLFKMALPINLTKVDNLLPSLSFSSIWVFCHEHT